MPWACLKCGQPTYRRDRICCHSHRRGSNNQLSVRRRLREKTTPTHSSGKFKFPVVVEEKAAERPHVQATMANESMAEALEARRDLFRQVFSNDANYHSAMAVAHSIMQRITSNSESLLQTSKPNLCGLVGFAMTLSARLTDDQVDVYCQRMLKVMSVSLFEMQRSQCYWVNLYHDCGDNRDIPVLGD